MALRRAYDPHKRPAQTTRTKGRFCCVIIIMTKTMSRALLMFKSLAQPVACVPLTAFKV